MMVIMVTISMIIDNDDEVFHMAFISRIGIRVVKADFLKAVREAVA